MSFILRKTVPIIMYFDHLDSELKTITPPISDETERAAIKLLHDKRRAGEKKKRASKGAEGAGETEDKVDELSWQDLYTFELILAQHLPVEKLRSKVMQLRNDYRSIVGQQEFDQYMAAKPPDLMNPPDPTDPPHANQLKYERLVREDLKDLLDRLFARYEMLPIREAKLKRLTWLAAGLCLAFLALLLIGIIVSIKFQYSGVMGAKPLPRPLSLTIFMVVAAGAMGGFVSALMRIQSPNNSGSLFYNLAQLFYGSYAVFVAPITGAIFAIILYLMFTSHVLTGTFFPDIYTPPPDYVTYTLQKPSDASSRTSNSSPAINSNTAASSNTGNTSGARLASNKGSNMGRISNAATSPDATSNSGVETTSNATNTTSTDNAASNLSGTAGNRSLGGAPHATGVEAAPTPVATPVPIATQSLDVMIFLAESGPEGGKDYALLILWCFIAGFAERFVPDALDRLITQKGVGNGNT